MYVKSVICLNTSMIWKQHIHTLKRLPYYVKCVEAIGHQGGKNASNQNMDHSFIQ